LQSEHGGSPRLVAACPGERPDHRVALELFEIQTAARQLHTLRELRPWYEHGEMIGQQVSPRTAASRDGVAELADVARPRVCFEPVLAALIVRNDHGSRFRS
jgi:hypothetical protein